MYQKDTYAFARESSAHCRENQIYGIEPQTWKKFMPIGEGSINWIYSDGILSGAGSIFGPVFSGRRLAGLADAPFEAFCQFGVIDPRRQFIRIGVKNQRDL